MTHSDILETIKGSRRELSIIGLLPLTEDKPLWEKLSKEIFPSLVRSGVKITLIGESDNQLFQYSLKSDASYVDPDSRISFSTLKFRRELVASQLKKWNAEPNMASYSLSTLSLGTYFIRVDSGLWYSPSDAFRCGMSAYTEAKSTTSCSRELIVTAEHILDSNMDGRFLASPSQELLELYDQDHIPRGIYPRSCFYDTDHYQFVVWGLVFNRAGELLIHQRAENAKDNQGQWDKSVGGHVDFTQENSSNLAAVRELIEELFTKEDSDSQNVFLAPLTDSPIYLGDWRPDNFGVEYLSHVSLLESDTKRGWEPWVYYKLPGTIEHDTPRLLPNGTTRKLRVIADVFVFISDTSLNRRTLTDGTLENSTYDLVAPSELKSWVDQRHNLKGEFKATPDLTFIMNGKLRGVVEQISQLIQYAEIRK
ncbi:MAG: NUDIX domain-containing protein [Gammaproteobacteria bacterium]|nr:NUDIX domain-containing protein [Gammaproteobacteria bacterium]MCP5138037.1 NUDIX domain-containing protein [Gammaproteobacteria bacterium]